LRQSKLRGHSARALGSGLDQLRCSIDAKYSQGVTVCPMSVNSTMMPTTASLGGIRGFRATRSALGKIPFLLADIGEGIKECEVMEWLVKPGDTVEQFQGICEVQSDKATVVVSSRYDGEIISLEWKVGDMAQVGQPLVWMEVEGKEAKSPDAPKAQDSSAAPAAEASKEEPEPVVEITSPPRILEREGSFSVDPVIRPSSSPAPDPSTPRTSPVRQDDKLLATPAVRRLARDHDLDLSLIEGTGPKGRILKGDVLSYISSVPLEERRRQAEEARARAAQEARDAKKAKDGEFQEVQQTPAPAASEDKASKSFTGIERLTEDVVVPVRGVQRIMVKSMEASLRIPHFNLMEEYEMTQMAVFRAQLKAVAESRGLKLSYMPILIKATSLALVRYPSLNGHINADATEVTQKASHNIGVAMDTPRGLLVPVIKDVQNKSIFDVAQDLVRLQELGKNNKLGEAELTGATFTLSNIGAIGGTYASPVIPSPTLVIGAIGKIQTLPRFIDEANVEAGVRAAKIMNMSWAADHRVVDGATMARFSNQLKQYLESPSSMISDLH